jgi:hypothetical protein
MATYLTSAQVAERYQVSPATVKDWRYHGTGPEWVNIGGKPRYRLSDLERWEREREAVARAR